MGGDAREQIRRSGESGRGKKKKTAKALTAVGNRGPVLLRTNEELCAVHLSLSLQRQGDAGTFTRQFLTLLVRGCL